MTDDELLQVIQQAAQEGATSLNLSFQGFTSLPQEIGQLTQLTSLYLRYNDLTSLPESIGQLTQLRTLGLSRNQLTSLPESIGQLTQLNKLDLSHNQLTSLPESIEQLTQLIILSIGFNQLISLPQLCEVLRQLTQLTRLDISRNQLTSLPEALAQLCEVLRQLTQLTRLDISRNQMTSLPEEIGQLTQLTRLDLNFNQLTSLPESIGQLTKLKQIDLNFNQLTSLPESIGQLTKLKQIDLRSNQLTSLPESIRQLTKLKQIDLSFNQLTSLPESVGQLTQLDKLDLGNNQLDSLPEWIGQLTKLKQIDLRSNQLTSLSESIGQLTQLTKLDLRFNQLTSLSEAIWQLTQLTELDLSYYRLTSLSESIGQLTQLTKLDLSSNQLTSLPPEIGQLSNLTGLDLSSNQLTSLPPEIGQLSKLRSLDLKDNRLVKLPPEFGQLRLTKLTFGNNPWENLPPEIRKGGVKAILNFCRQLEQELDRLYEAKLLIIGEPGAGKTTLAKKIQDGAYELQPDEESTDGIEILQYRFPMADGKEFRVNIWDFGGQQIYHETHQFFLTKRSLYALVADARKEDTDFYYWLKVVELLSDNSPLLIVKNEKQNIQLAINERQLRGEFTNFKETLATNFANNRGLPELLSQIKHYISNLPHVGTELPKTWVKVREALEQKPDNYISLEAFLQLCQDNGFTRHEDKLQLSGYLHDLGVCLHFQEDDLLCKTVILKPTWGTDAVYKVLRNPHVTKNLGKFTKQDLATIWRDEQYATMRPELLRLMMNFKLCYEIPTHPDNYIAPQLLSPEQPDYAWDETNNLLLRYEYEFMPKGILTRFIVEMHRWIEQQTCVWKTGVVLHKDDARAEVTELYRYHKGEIRIRVSGKRRRDFLTTIRHELDKIHESYKRQDDQGNLVQRLKYSTLVPCNCQTCQNNQTPHFYLLEVLHRALDSQTEQVQCQSSFQMVGVRRLVDDIADNWQPAPPAPEPGSTTTINIQTAYGVAGNVEQDQAINPPHKNRPDGDV